MCFWVFSGVCFLDPLNAQTTLRLSNEMVRGLPEIWSVQIQQMNTSEQSVYLLTNVREKNVGEVYKAKSIIFLLAPGIVNIDIHSLQPLETLLNRLPDEENLPNGSYWVQISLMDADQNREIVSTICKTEITNGRSEQTFQIHKPSKIKSHWASDGRAKVVYSFNNPVPAQTNLPRSVVRTDFQSHVTIFHLPLEVNGLFSTENGDGFSPVNQLGISLDKAAVKAQALKWLNEKMSPEHLFDSTDIERAAFYRNMLRDKKYPEYQKWKEKLDGMDMDSELRNQQQLEGLETTLNNTALKKQISELDALKEEYSLITMDDLSNPEKQVPDSLRQKLSSLFRLEQSYSKMEQQLYELKLKEKKIRKYSDLYKKVKSIDRQQDIGDIAKSNDDIREGMKMFGQTNRLQNLIMGVDELEIGSCYPYFSKLTLGGVRLRGANIGYTSNRKLHVGITGGQKQGRMNLDTNFQYIQQSPYAQYLLGLQIGIGRPDGNYFYIHHLRGSDYGSGNVEPTSNNESIKPRSNNYVTGLSFQYKDLRQIVLIMGEINQSLFNPNVLAPENKTGNKNNVARYLRGRSLYGSALDISYQGAFKVNLPNGITRFSGSIQHVDPGYQSFGVPFLLQDLNRYDIRVVQSFFKKKASIGAYYKRDYDQTSAYAKLFRTITTGWGSQISIKPRKSIIINIDYSPYSQQRDAITETQSFSRKGNILVSSVQVQSKGKMMQVVTQGSWIFQNLHLSDSVTLYQIHSFQFSNQWINKRYIFSFTGQFSPRRSQSESSTLTSTDVSSTILQLFKRLNFTIGGQYMQQTNSLTLKGAYCRGSFRINHTLQLDINIRHAYINRFTTAQKYVQNNGWLTLGVRW